jgi:hypothetical protein
MRVRLNIFELDRATRRRSAARELRLPIFEPLRQDDPRAVLVAVIKRPRVTLSPLAEISSGPPANIQEFNRIAGLVFAQLYAQFPATIDIDRIAIAKALGAEGANWSDQLASRETVGEQIANTIGWLNHQGYTFADGGHPAEHVILTEKGLAALNAVPQGLSVTVGTSLVSAAGDTRRDWSSVGDLMGGLFGGFTKSMSGS